MKHGSLFSGIGGFDLAAEWMGWENIFHCEWNEFGQKVLKHYWPNAETFTDITKTDFRKYANKIDVLTGGFPCQPYSQAGKRLGKEDERHLWPEMLRAIREIRPSYIVGENVSGLVNWNGGMVFDEVQADLEAEGYEVQAVLLPAASVNAPHKRERVWFVAYSNSCANLRGSKKDEGESSQERVQKRDAVRESNESDSLRGDVTNTNNPRTNNTMRDNRNREESNERREGQSQSKYRQNGVNGNATHTTSERQPRKEHREEGAGLNSKKSIPIGWQNFPAKPPICSGNDGVSNRLDGITFPKWRNESIKAYGNAIVPQVALQIFKAICS